jgi:hypothetical protein
MLSPMGDRESTAGGSAVVSGAVRLERRVGASEVARVERRVGASEVARVERRVGTSGAGGVALASAGRFVTAGRFAVVWAEGFFAAPLTGFFSVTLLIPCCLA